MLENVCRKEIEDEKNQPDVEYEQDDLKSTFQKDFNIDEFSARESAPTNVILFIQIHQFILYQAALEKYLTIWLYFFLLIHNKWQLFVQCTG